MRIFAFSKIFWFIGIIHVLAFLSVPCYSDKSPKAWNLAQENLFFVGREEQLEAISCFFKKQDRRVLALTGAPGFGKTQIAKRFAQTFADNYDFIWWFDAQQDIPNQLQRLIVVLNTLLPPQDKIIPSTMSKEAFIDIVKNILSVKNIRYLFIFDNTENYEKIEKYIPYVHNNHSEKHVLLTSRNPNVWIDKVEIGKFKRNESLQLIKTILPREKDNDIETLAKTFSDHPLGLSIAIKGIKSSPTMTIPKYLSMPMNIMFKHKAREQNTMLDSYPHDPQSALLISFKLIEENHKDALQTLFFMSLLNSKDIPEAYIESWLEKTNSFLITDDDIKYIYDQSLIDIRKESEKDTHNSGAEHIMHYLSLHDLTHQLINEQLSIEEKKKLLDKATEVMLEVFAGRSYIFIKKITKEPIHLLHAQKLCENAQKIGYTSSKLLQLKVCIFELLASAMRNFEAAKLVLEDIEKDLTLGLKLEPYYEALLKINKGFFECVNNVNYDEAIRNMSEGLTILTPFKEYSEERLRAISNIAQYHILRGEADAADQFIKQGRLIFSNSTNEVCNSLYVYVCSFVLNDQGKFEESLKILDKAKEYPNLKLDYQTLYHSILQQRIETLIKQQRFEEAQENLDEYEERIQKYFQGRYKTYLGLGSALYFKSLISLHKGVPTQKIIQYLSEAIKLYDEVLRGDKKHRYQARTHFALGMAHAANKDYSEALKAYLFSEEIYNSVFKEKNVDDVSELYAELAMLGEKLKDEELTRKYLRKHIDTFGLDHPRTKEIIKNLDDKNLRLL